MDEPALDITVETVVTTAADRSLVHTEVATNDFLIESVRWWGQVLASQAMH